MKSTVFSSKTDAKLMPPAPIRNLCVRNGIFYFRRMVKGKRILKSLRTKNPILAQYLILELETMYLLKTPGNPLVITKKNFTKNKNMLLSDILLAHEHNKHKGQQMKNVASNITQTVGHSIQDIWKTKVAHAFNETNQKTADTRVATMLSMLGCSTIEELDADPHKIDEMKTQLFDYEQPFGKNKGQKYTKKTIKEHFRLMRQIILTADTEFGLGNTDKLLRKLKLPNTVASKDFSQTKARAAFDEDDYKKLFECMAQVKNKDLSGLKNMRKNYTKDDVFLIDRLCNYPEQWYFAILLALYTGGRSNAINTLRHQDIDLTNNTINFHRNKSLIKQNDIREMQKRLKTEESERVVPIASVLLNDLGLKDYLIQHELKHGKSAFIFEEFISTENGYKDSYLNQAVNKLFIQLGIKPNKDSKVLKDFHSLKKCFYTCNLGHAGDLEVLEALAGNKPSKNSIAARCYTQLSMDTSKSILINAVEKITYPYIEILLGKKDSDNKDNANNGAITYTTPTTPSEERSNPNNPLNNPVLRKEISKIIKKPVRGMVVYNNSATFFMLPNN